jgi:hypothetical protein
MFVYQNKAGHICVTFAGNKPVEAPEYVIAVDEAAKKLYMVSGTIEEMPEQEEEVVEKTVVVETPKVEELDDVVENDTMQELEFAPVTEANNSGAPALDDIREKIEGEAEDANEKAPVTEAENLGDPTVEELDDIPENDAE